MAQATSETLLARATMLEKEAKRLSREAEGLRSQALEARVRADSSAAAIMERYRKAVEKNPAVGTSAQRRWAACEQKAAADQAVKELSEKGHPVPPSLGRRACDWHDCISG